jgi:hypothetical protein
MSLPPIDEAELQRILARAGLELTPDQVRSILPGAAIVQRMIERVNAPLPREAEPAVIFRVGTFKAEKR